MSDLKPCPYCGEKPKLVEPCTKLYPKKEQAIEAWNRRANDG